MFSSGGADENTQLYAHFAHGRPRGLRAESALRQVPIAATVRCRYAGFFRTRRVGGVFTPHRFADRRTAGEQLARRLAGHRWGAPVIVLGLPRGGVAVAQPVARALHAPLDVLVVRKVGWPAQPELAIGALASGGISVRDAGPLDGLSRSEEDETFDRVAQKEWLELARREQVYRADLPPLELRDKTAIVIDDGLATGSTMLAAVRAARAGGAAEIIAAAPVASGEAVQRLSEEADEVVVLEVPPMLSAIGEWYAQFEQLDDAEVCRLLERGGGSPPA